MQRVAAALLCAVIAQAPSVQAHTGVARPSPAATPRLTLTLAPHSTDGKVDYIDISMTLQHPRVKAGQPLLSMALLIASIPTMRYDGQALRAHDDSGELPLSQQDATPNPMVVERTWAATRATHGDVTFIFRDVPRAVDASTQPGPLYDLRAEGAGFMGAGATFLPLPPSEKPYLLHLRWNLAAMAPASIGVTCLGEGNVDRAVTLNELAFCYYAAGPLKVYRPSGGSGSRFAMYWLTEPPFDIHRVANQIGTLFTYMSRFFHDDGGSYRIFIRKNPYPSGGGTAATRSFMFGWSAQRPATADELEALLSHEMTHNWPQLEGSHGETSWYSEGNAEYYSTLLSWQAHVISPETFLERVNDKAAGYYTNPLIRLTNEQADARYWQDKNASHIPYGRGFMYLAIVDAQIRAKSHGHRSLANVVLNLLDRERHHQSYGVSEWISLLTRELGPQARQEYEDMAAGDELVPPANTFGPCFKPEPYGMRAIDLGFAEGSLYSAQRVIEGVQPGSNAAAAGLRDGDQIIGAANLEDAIHSRHMRLTILRNGQKQQIDYAPVGKAVPGYRWVRSERIPDGACRY